MKYADKVTAMLPNLDADGQSLSDISLRIGRPNSGVGNRLNTIKEIVNEEDFDIGKDVAQINSFNIERAENSNMK